MNTTGPVTIYEALTSYEAHIMCNMLEVAGIKARVASSAIESHYGKIPFQTCPVVVDASDAESARAILEAYQHRMQNCDDANETTEAIFCYHCGEAVQAGDARCPACNGQLDWSE